jgi:hypothetical protein
MVEISFIRCVKFNVPWLNWGVLNKGRLIDSIKVL